MDFDSFTLSRDLLYFSGAFVGLALGCIASLFRKDINPNSRNRRISLSFLLFSAAIVLLAATIIVSMADIFKETGLLITAACFVPVFAAAVCFPRAAAYPLILVAGLLVVWTGYAILRFPPVQSGSVPLAVIEHPTEDRYIIKLYAAAGDKAPAELPQTSGGLSSLQFTAGFISVDRRCPLIGGTIRGMITGICGGGPVYSDQSMQSIVGLTRPKAFKFPAINIQTITGTVPFETVPAGVNLNVQYDNSDDGGLVFTSGTGTKKPETLP